MKYIIERINLKNGVPIEVGPGDTTIVVGPNNAGKTTLLREILESAVQVTGHKWDRKIVSTIDIQMGSVEDYGKWLTGNFSPDDKGTYSPLHMESLKYLQPSNTSEDAHRYQWKLALEKDPISERSQRVFAFFTVGRLDHSICYKESMPIPPYDIYGAHPIRPMQIIMNNSSLVEKMNYEIAQAFPGFEISLDPRHSHPVYAYFKRKSDVGGPTERLDLQGAGVRSFVGVLAGISASPLPVLLIDEPETFLHPAQARALGRSIIRTKSPSSQLFLATHSVDLLEGVLEEAKHNIRIVRVERERITTISPADAQSLLRSPVNRAGRVLDALFHEMTVLCEAPRDALFYRALAAGGQSDVFFFPTNGKGGMKSIHSSLSRFGVDVRIIADIDILRDKHDFECYLLPEHKDAAASAWDALKFSSETCSFQGSKDEIKSKILDYFEKDLASVHHLSSEHADKIKGFVRGAKIWDEIKKQGMNHPVMAHGDIRAIIEILRDRAIFVVPVGEIEQFYKCGASKQRWLMALETQLKENWPNDQALDQARRFMEDVLAKRGP